MNNFEEENLLTMADKLTNLYLNKYCLEPEIVKYLLAPEISKRVLKYLLSNIHRVNKPNKRVIDIKKIIKEEKKKIKSLLINLAKCHKDYHKLYLEAKKKKQPAVIIEFFRIFDGCSEKEIKEYLGV
ncbi:hypothetical protein DRN69_01910 [Candidatus Pacearchaeota archaeon]|nr:MAG: hypothetical protein DRN69_01910 [Candidatus Pacearchaeota archaeon]